MTTPLKESLHRLAARQDARFPEEAARHGADAAFAALRDRKFRETVAWAAERSPFYRERIGAGASAVRGLADIGRLPFTTAADLAANPYRLLCVSQDDIERAISFTSSGTTGPAKRVFFSLDEIEAMTDFMAAGLATVAAPGDVVQILLPEGPALGQCDLLARGAAKLGAEPVVSGLFKPPAEQIDCIREHGSTVLFGETRLLYRITKAMEGKVDLASLGVRTLFVTTSHNGDALVRGLERAWGAQVVSHYGLSEMGLGLAVDCPVCGGRHFDALDVYAEAIDPETGEVLPCGEEGELVFTTLSRRAMPLLRYRSGDIGRICPADPACPSAPLEVLSPVLSRRENGVAVGGRVLHPTDFDDVLFDFDAVVDYDLSVEAAEGAERLMFEVESKADAPDFEAALLAAIIRHSDSLGLAGMLPPRIQHAAPGELLQGRHFKKLIYDLR